MRTTNRMPWLLLVGALVTAAAGRGVRADEEAAAAATKPVEKAAPDETADTLAKQKQEEAKEQEAARRAADQQRKQQIAQQAQNMQQFFQPALQAELERVRKTCGSLSVDARKKILAAGNETVTVLARQVVERQFAGQGMQGFDHRQTIHGAVAAAVKPHAAAEEFAAYEREHAARIARRDRVARILIVNKLDAQLRLSQSQREKIAADLEKHWEAGWLRELHDQGMMINHYRPAPDFADKCIAPHLDDSQRAEWKQWCQQAGLSRMGNNGGWNFDGQSMQPDPWWSK
jgi:hypothetical protein